MSLSTPLIRVARKRTADSQPSIVVNFKRAKADPVLFSLYKTSEAPVANDEEKAPAVIDFRHTVPVPSSIIVDEIDETSPLSFAVDSVGEVGAPEPSCTRQTNDDVITVNGRPLVRADDDIVFDFYKLSRGVIDENNVVFDAEDCDMRFATKEDELMFYANSESGSDPYCEDDDDSNDEGNWRNDYPDEDGDGSESDDEREDLDFDSYGYDSDDDDGGLRLRMQRFGLDAESDQPGSDDED